MTLSVEVGGKPFENFVSIEVRAGFDTLARSFSFEARADDISNYTIKVGDAIRVLADGKSVCNGYIDRISASYSGSNHIIGVTGRSKTSDVVDSSLKAASYNFSKLKDMIEWLLVILNINFPKEKIQVIDDVGSSVYGNLNTPIPVKSAQNAFDFIEGLCRKLQVLVRDDGDGNIVICRNTQLGVINFALNNQIDDPSGLNNIKKANVSLDHSDRCNEYIVDAQQSTAQINLLGTNTEAAEISSQSGSAFDNDIRKGRTMVSGAEKAMSSEDARNRAVWQANVNKARSLQASVTVQGHVDNSGNPFDVGKLILYNDDLTGVNSLMLIDGIIMSYNEDDGSETEFTLLPPEAYTPELVSDDTKDNKAFTLQLDNP